MPIAALLLAAAAASSAPLAPTGPWVVHVDENMCLLERNYALGADQVTLVFQPLLDLDSMELYVVTSDRSGEQFTGTFTAGIAPDAQAFNGHYFSVLPEHSKHRVTRLTTQRRVLNDLKDGDTFSLKAKPVNLTFKIARPEKARVALQACTDDLKKSWGIDAEMESRVVTPLDGNPARYFSSSSYPREALAKRIYGRVVALLNISPEGTVEHCRIVSSAGPELNDGTCKAAARIRFKPARDRDGKGLPATYLLPVRWTMPGAPQ